MKYLSIATTVALALATGACSTQSATTAHTDLETLRSLEAPRETILLVSLDDGSVVKQTIHSDADLCFKLNSQSTTTCLTQGAPVIDPVTNAIVGFKMIEDHIDLVAQSQ